MEFIISIIFLMLLILAIFVPYLIFFVVIAVIVLTIITKKIASKALKAAIIMVVLLYGFVILGSFRTETPDNIYTEIKKIDDNQSLIGLSSEEVVNLLGEPKGQSTSKENKKQYVYNAGSVLKESYWGYSYYHDYYNFYVYFDENDKVEDTLIKMLPKED